MHTQLNTFRLFILLSVIAAGVLHDIRVRKIPNHIAVGGALLGIVGSLLPGGVGLAQSIGGIGLGLAMLLPMYALRAMGAGDVKLMAAAGAFLGLTATFFAVLFTFALGGVLAIVYSAYAGTLGQTMRNLKTFIYASAIRVAGGGVPRPADMPVGKDRMPYSLAIAGGVSSYLAAHFYSTGVFA